MTIIAALTARLGGDVTITAEELYRYRRPTMTHFYEPESMGVTVQVQIPVDAIDAEFQVVRGDPRRLR